MLDIYEQTCKTSCSSVLPARISMGFDGILCVAAPNAAGYLLTGTMVIQGYIGALGEHQLFGNWQLLPFASRSLIDKVLSNLHKKGDIVRLAQGVYMKNSPNMQIPSIDQIVSFKARAFSRKAVSNTSAAVKDLGYAHPDSGDAIYLTDGATSRFNCLDRTVRLQHISQRKLHTAILVQKRKQSIKRS